MLPMPWPTSSLLGLWRVRVMESATREVSRLSMEPSSAMMSAGWTACTNALTDSSGNCTSGRPVGTSPMIGVSAKSRTPSSVPMINAPSVAGKNLLSCLGQMTPTTRVTRAMASALRLTSAIALGKARTDPTGPPVVTEWPRNGRICSRMMIIPMPDMKPDITE